MLFDQRSTDGQTKAGAFLGPLQLAEPIENFIQLVGRNPGAVVDHGNANWTIRISHFDLYHAFGR